jgi:hypothetical protein
MEREGTEGFSPHYYGSSRGRMPAGYIADHESRIASYGTMSNWTTEAARKVGEWLDVENSAREVECLIDLERFLGVPSVMGYDYAPTR